MRIEAVVAGAGIFAIVVACGSSESPNGASANDAGASETSSSSSSSGATSSSGGSSSGTIGSPCLGYAQGLCGWLYRCVPNDVRLAFADVASCTDHVLIDCERTSTAAGAAMMTAACGAELLALSCAAPIDFKVPPVVRTPACDLRGTLLLGKSCERDRQCADGACAGTFVTSNGDIACGKCRALVAENGACNEEICDVGLQCTNTGTCKKPPAKGETCTTRQCAKPLRCVATKCADALGAGAPCSMPIGDEDPCDATLSLACTSGTCQPSVTPTTPTKADGESCTETRDCFWPAACVQGSCTVPVPKCK